MSDQVSGEKFWEEQLIETVEFNLDILFLIYKRFKQSIKLIILKVLFLRCG